MNRLTRKDGNLTLCNYNNNNCNDSCIHGFCKWHYEAINKLGKLEDIMEKYGIESVEELELVFHIINKKDNKDFVEANDEVKRVAYNYVKNLVNVYKENATTWKKACELACMRIIDFESDNQESYHSAQYWFDYFYAQAQKEVEDGKDKRKNN